MSRSLVLERRQQSQDDFSSKEREFLEAFIGDGPLQSQIFGVEFGRDSVLSTLEVQWKLFRRRLTIDFLTKKGGADVREEFQRFLERDDCDPLE